jgi:hypothetical protein
MPHGAGKSTVERGMVIDGRMSGWFDFLPFVGSTEPEYPGIYYGQPESLEDWSCNDWILYHQQLVVMFGQELANQIISADIGKLDVWNKTQLEWCKVKCDFYHYFKSYGWSFNSIIAPLVCGSVSVVETTADVVEEVADDIGSLKKLIVPLAVIAGLALLDYNYTHVILNKKKQ